MIESSEGNKRFFGVYRGTVTNSKDPNQQRRVRLTVPQVLGEEATDWAWPMDSASVKAHPPKVGQGVWVSFEGGDPSFPVWSGTFGSYKGTGYQVDIPDLPKKGSYPKTITRNVKNNQFDLTAAVVDIAKKVEEIRRSLNSHGGSPEAAPTDVAP